MSHPGWLANKILTVEAPGKGSLQLRVLGVNKDILVVSAPSSDGETAWLAKNSTVSLRVQDLEEGRPAEPATPQVASIEATIVERRLKPMPILFLRLTHDLPFTAAMAERRNRIVVVTSGKGGAGKTFVSVNLASAWGQAGLKVALVDGDIGTANVATSLGLRPQKSLTEVITGRASLSQIALPSDHGFTVFPGTVGDEVGADLSPWQFARIISGLGEIEAGYDQIIVDTGAGISRNVTGLLYVADFILLVVNETPTSIVDAYALIKKVASQFWIPEVGLIVNRVDGSLDEDVVQRFLRTAREYLSVPVVFLGYVRDDAAVMRSLKSARPLITASPEAPAAQDVQTLASVISERLAYTAQPRHLRPRVGR